MRAFLVAAIGLAVALVAAGCGGKGSATSTRPTTTTPAQTATVRVYFLRNGQVWPVARRIDDRDHGAAAFDELLAGPLAPEARDLRVITAIPERQSSMVFEQKPVPGTPGHMEVSLGVDLPRPALAQVVYTLTQFPSGKPVAVNGKFYTREDFEGQTPPILVESPLSGATVTSPIRVTGTANTFEATFQYELRDATGKILSKHFEMATSGSGTRGTFDFTVPFTVDHAQRGKLVLYEDSAEDGSRIHVQEIPLELSP